MEKSLPCDQCDHYFSTELKRKQHIQRYHSQQINPEEQWQCDICGKVFDQEKVLKNHKSLHMIQHHKQLQAQKKKEAEEAAKKKGESEEGDGQPPESQPEPQAGQSSQSSAADVSMTSVGETSQSTSGLLPGDILGRAVVIKKQEDDTDDQDLEDVLSQL